MNFLDHILNPLHVWSRMVDLLLLYQRIFFKKKIKLTKEELITISRLRMKKQSLIDKAKRKEKVSGK